MRNTSPDRAPRTSHKLVGPLGAPGPPIGATHPPGQLWRPALPIPPVGPPPSELRRDIRPAARALRTSLVAMPIGKIRPGHREAARGGCKRALERTVLLKGGLQPPLGRPDHAAPRPQDGTGSTRSAGGCVRPATSAGSRTRRTRAGACGRWRGQPGGWRRSTRPRGAPGDRPGAANEPWKERSFQGRLAAPPGRSRAQSRSRTAWLPDPLRRGRGSPQRRPRPRNLRGKRRIGAASTRIFR